MKKSIVFIEVIVLLFFLSVYCYADYNQTLQGTWTTPCIYDASNGTYRKITMIISGNELFSTHNGSWSESECLNNSYFYTSTLTGRFSIGEDIDISEAKELDIVVSSCTITWLTDHFVNYVNANSWYGINDWQKDVPRDISGKTHPDGIIYPRIGETFFSVIKIDGNKAYLGTDDAGFILNEKYRPTTLESWFYNKNYVKTDVLGDINMDGKVNLSESIYALQVAAGFREKIGTSNAMVFDNNGNAFIDSDLTVSNSTQYGGLKISNGTKYIAELIGSDSTNDGGMLKLYKDGNTGVQISATHSGFFHPVFIDSDLTVSNSVQYGGLKISNGTKYIAELIGSDSTNDGGMLKLYKDGIAKVEINTTDRSYFNGGNVGIGTTEPSEKLEVSGTVKATAHVSDLIKLRPRSNAPTSPSEGDMYMDSTDHKLKVYDGITWQACW